MKDLGRSRGKFPSAETNLIIDVHVLITEMLIAWLYLIQGH
jgi:hypothetical protein